MTEATTQSRREYETVYVLRPTATVETAKNVSDRIEKVLAATGGTLTLAENWGRRELAYKVQGHRRAIYVLVRYVGNGVTVSEIERNFRMVDDVMKYQTVLHSAEVAEADAVAFPEFEVTDEEEPEVSLAEELGLVESARRRVEHVEDEPEDENEAALEDE